VYLNNAFSRRPLPEVAAAMQPYLRERYENPLTESEQAEEARALLQHARTKVAALIGADPEEIVFVSSGTEANNWALKGLAAAQKSGKGHLVISAVEHFSVYQTALYLQRQGFELTILPVDEEGRIDVGELARAIKPATFLVSVQAAGDEVGVIQDIDAVSHCGTAFHNVAFHSDAIQYLCYESFDVRRLPLNAVSISSNAIYGPPGIAALYIRRGTRIVPLLHGGMQEDGLRPGLQSMALVAGFAKAAELNLQRKAAWKTQLLKLRSQFFALLDGLEISVTGSRAERTADNVHGIVDVDGEALLTLLEAEGVSASSGSTCYRFAQKESHVLQALGVSAERARGAMLFTPGIDVTEEDVQMFGEKLRESVKHLRSIKPAT
jgi:cysteine desulfurase